MRHLITIIAGAMLLAGAAQAQSFPEDDEFTTYNPWTAGDTTLSGSVRTDGEGGWAVLAIERMSSSTMNAIPFTYSIGTYDADFVNSQRRYFGRNIASQVSVRVDGQSFRPVSAVMQADDEGGITMEMTFYDPADETSPDVWEKSCPVVAAIKRGRSVSVVFPPESDGWLPLTGRGSSAALSDVC
tara:strand:- start:2546 stop:3100 length:555 start_codon:yes stop_codon:yes gene_type:complete